MTQGGPDLWQHENRARALGYMRVAGVDEAGRGPLAGPVVAAAVVLDPPLPDQLQGLNDSKQLTARQRERFFVALTESLKVPFGVGVVSVDVIDRINILQATYLAMREALQQLPALPDFVLVDGRAVPDLAVPQQGIVGGDGSSYSIAAASVIAKVTRDRIMQELHEQFPQYNFARHKGYGTAEHLAMLRQFGPCAVHRRSFEPIRTCSL